MAKKTFRLLEQGVASGYAPFAGVEAGAEIEHDFGADTERAVLAAGWVELIDEPDSKSSTKKKEG